MAPSKHKRHKKLLSNTRPAFVTGGSSTNTPSLSSRSTRSIIRRHHNLHKQIAQAQRNGAKDQVTSLTAQLENAGGLVSYQQASTQGQAATRGGDSSRVLVEWFREMKDQRAPNGSIRLLEVGALRVDNACARSNLFTPTRIDLRSNHPDIEQEDFMQRPLPDEDAEKFDVVSLSLVLNYVSEAVARGAMLKRVGAFLRDCHRHLEPTNLTAEAEPKRDLLPGLFLVLPAPCVRNSRYLDEDRLMQIMTALGYACRRKKYSDKLAYFYWQYTANATNEKFAKKEVVRGVDRNNFAIVLK